MSTETPSVNPGPTPTYSIIVAAYNVAEYIDDCLSSLLVDTVENCEIIVVNDGSTDNTRLVIARYENDPRVRVIDKRNGGVSDARNQGLMAARGRYIMFVDGDDWLEPNLIPAFDAAIQQHPGTDFITFSFYEVYGTERYPHYCRADFWGMTNSPCNKLFHRDLLENIQFDCDIAYEDLAVVPYLFTRATAPLTLDALLYNYRRDRLASAMNSVDPGHLSQLVEAAQRSISKILHGEATGEIAPVAPRLGHDWQERFETIEIFIPGVLHFSRKIPDRRTRRDYIKQMMARLPDRQRIQPDIVQQKYGRKMALGSRLYRMGHSELAHFLLHDTGAIKHRLLHPLSNLPRNRDHPDRSA
ncbi:glycosyltransferase family A protein [Salinisphaera sp. SPP-AMP-43]|uniref:glycosyltransferase family 2 protein n=1 Tax=Salinisphaera sp. SPP-AMP-43 TaxID=3121288 RepID=UPI003C6E7AF4